MVCNGWVQHDLAVQNGVKWARVVWQRSGSNPVTAEDFSYHAAERIVSTSVLQ